MKRILAYTVAFDPPDSGGCRQLARMLGASISRTYLNGILCILHNSLEPVFLVNRNEIDEYYVKTPNLNDQPLADLANAWKFRAGHVLDPTGFDVVLFLDADCLVLRNIDHLFYEDDWDILYQPESGRPIQSNVFNGYLTDQEMMGLCCNGRNAGTWAVRSEIYNDVMQTWEDIMNTEPLREWRFQDQTAWNRLLLDAPLKGWSIKPFEAHEIQFPLHLDKDWLQYKDAAIIHCVGGNNLEKIEFIFGMYAQKFFHDSKGTLPNILDM